MSVKIIRTVCYLALLWVLPCCLALGQISDGLYKTLPDSFKPSNKTRLTIQDQLRILKGTSDFAVKGYANELKVMADGVDKLVRQTNDTKLRAEASYALGEYYRFLNESPKAIAYFRQTLHFIGTSNAFNPLRANAFAGIAHAYYTLSSNAVNGQDDSATHYLYKSLQVEGVSHDSGLLAKNYNLYSIIYGRLGAYPKAIYYGNLARQTTPSATLWNNTYTELVLVNAILYNRRYALTKKALYADSARYLLREIMAAKRAQAASWYGYCYLHLGINAYELGQYRTSLGLLDSARLARYRHGWDGQPMDYARLDLTRALSLIKLGAYGQGRRLLAGLRLPKLVDQRRVYQALYEAAQQARDWQQAFVYYQRYRTVSDSIDEAGRQVKLFEAEQKYALSKKEADIARLEVQNLVSQQEKREIFLLATLMLLALALPIYVAYHKEKTKHQNERDRLTGNLQKIEDAMHLQQAQAQAENALAMDEQRRSISQNMHDEISNDLITLQYYIADFKNSATYPETRVMLTDIEQETQHIYKQTRAFMHRLHNSTLQAQYNVVDFLAHLAQDFRESSSLTIHTEVNEEAISQYFTSLHHSEVYRIIKEAVTNSLKHSGASRMEVILRYESDAFWLQISDNGKGMSASPSGGMGLDNMHQRMTLLKGSFQVIARPTGMEISCRFPAVLAG